MNKAGESDKTTHFRPHFCFFNGETELATRFVVSLDCLGVLGEPFAREMGREGDINQEKKRKYIHFASISFDIISECTTFVASL